MDSLYLWTSFVLGKGLTFDAAGSSHLYVWLCPLPIFKQDASVAGTQLPHHLPVMDAVRVATGVEVNFARPRLLSRLGDDALLLRRHQ